MENKIKINKKRKRDNNTQIDIENESGLNIEDKEKNEIINVEFIFSCINEEHFIMIKNLLRPNFQFENISLNGLADLVIQMREYVGTTIKQDNEEEDKIFGVFTLIPLTFYNTNPITKQIFKMIEEKIKNDNKLKNKINLILKKKIGFLINERIINLPHELIPPAMNFISNEVFECINEEDYDKRFDIDYIIIMTKFVKDINNNNYEIIYYKPETELFLSKSEIEINYKINYYEHDMEILENKNQPQFMNILFIKSNEFFNIISSMQIK